MKITVSHSTKYRYDFPVYLEPHIFWFRPGMTTTQQFLEFDIQIAPLLAGTTECLDQDGNLDLNTCCGAATGDLSVTNRFTVEMLRQNQFGYVFTGESLNRPLCYAEPLCAALTQYRQDAHVAESVKQFAKSAAAGAQWNTLSPSRQIFQGCRQSIQSYGRPWATATCPSDTVRPREGSHLPGFDHDLAARVAGRYSGGSPPRMEASLCLQVDDAS
jgi:hypothetical protein